MKPTATAHSVLAEAREEIAKRDQIILEQQARITHLRSQLCSEKGTFTDKLPGAALKAHDKEVRAKAFEDAMQVCCEVWSRCPTDINGQATDRSAESCVEELRRMAQEERKENDLPIR